MSTLYNLEPQPTAKVLLQTSSGDLLLELFAKQTPLASRNFLQHCLDGYYNNTIFHRLVPGFIIQGGDPTATGSGGESSYDGGAPFADEFHTRLKFNRRGLLGMANTGQKDDNGSQFFFTLGETPELTNKNTLFGRVASGDTIYNLMKMGEADLVEGGERPLYPTKVTGAEILVNPFDDMVKRTRIAERTKTEKVDKKKPKRKAGKALLSFGGEEEGDTEATPVMKKPKFNAKLVSAGASKPVLNTSKPMVEADSVPPAKSNPKPKRKSPSPSPPPVTAPPPKLSVSKKAVSRSPSPATSSSSEPENKVASALDRANAEIAALKASMKRNTATTAAPTRKKSALEAMIPATSTRGRKRQPGGTATEDKAALDLFKAFKNKLDNASFEPDKPRDPKPHGDDDTPALSTNTVAQLDTDEAALCDLHFIVNCQSCTSWAKGEGPADVGDNDAGWMSHALTFEKDRLGKDLEWKKKNEEELVVIDPREKARELGVEKVKEKGDRRDERGGGRKYHDRGRDHRRDDRNGRDRDRRR